MDVAPASPSASAAPDVASSASAWGLAALLHYLIPPASSRSLHTSTSLVIALALPSLLQLPLAWHLLHYPSQRCHRLLMLPFIIAVAVRCGFAGHVEYTQRSWLNLDLGISAAFTSIRCTWLATRSKAPVYLANDGKPSQPLLLELIGSMRFAGWDIGVPSSSQPRKEFILHRLKVAFFCYLAWDVLDVAVKHPLVNPATKLGIGSLQICREGPLGLFAEAIVFMSVGALFVYVSIQGTYAFNSALHVFFVPSSQPSWGELPYKFPLLADSIRSLWSTHWHDLFRTLFLDLAFRPTASFLRKLGLPRNVQKAAGVLAVFTLSGLMHEAGIEGMSWGREGQGWGAGVEGWSYATTRFFVLQGVGCVLEEAVAETTGVKIAGPLGAAWAWIWVVVTGWPMIDVWLRHGIIPAGPCSFSLSEPIVDALLTTLARWRNGNAYS